MGCWGPDSGGERIGDLEDRPAGTSHTEVEEKHHVRHFLKQQKRKENTPKLWDTVQQCNNVCD